MSYEQDFITTEAMIKKGGSFVRHLGKLWRLADTDNKDRLKKAFPEYWENYAIMGEGMKGVKSECESSKSQSP